jgi:hypothetical protein
LESLLTDSAQAQLDAKNTPPANGQSCRVVQCYQIPSLRLAI